MIGFFYSVYMALFNGNWQNIGWYDTMTQSKTMWQELTTWIANALGGNFDTMQTFTWTFTPPQMVSMFLAFFTLIGICFAVWKLVKAVFSIFFRGV